MLDRLVSVIIPVYNGEDYLHQAIESALNQTYENIEIIVVDDGSIDNTRNIMQSYGNKIKPIYKPNGGVSSALNVGIQNMSGEWFAWLSHDDLWDSNKIEKQVTYLLEHPEIDISYTSYQYVDENGMLMARQDKLVNYPKETALVHLVEKDYINGITPLVPSRCFREIGLFREDLRCVQDWDMWIRLMVQYNWQLIPEPLAKTRIHSKQTGTRLSSRCRREHHYLQREYLKKSMYPYYFPNYSNSTINIIYPIHRFYVTVFFGLRMEFQTLLGLLLPVGLKDMLYRLYNYLIR